MGPSGCGKTTVGLALARSSGATFIDADDHHPLTNVEKMKAGVPLTDEDREPWLDGLACLLAAHSSKRIVLACSALKARYRTRLTQGNANIAFACLEVPRDELTRRLAGRAGHFFPKALLHSQLTTLQLPEEGVIDGTQCVPAIVDELVRRTGWQSSLGPRSPV